MEEDRRKNSRIKKTLTVQYARAGSFNLKWEMSQIKDISDTGLSITTAESFSSDQNLLIRLKLPTHPYEWIDLDGSVVESQSFGGEFWLTRVKFIQLKEEDKTLIKDYIAWFLLKERGGK
jgi:c-di-GMP-binding flagellar brake protein YcgR